MSDSDTAQPKPDEAPKTETPTREMRVSAAVTELLKILKLDTTVPTVPPAEGTSTATQPAPIDRAAAREKLATGLQQRLSGGDFDVPLGANTEEAEKLTAQKKRLAGFAKGLSNSELSMSTANWEKLRTSAQEATAIFSTVQSAVEERNTARAQMTAELMALVPDGTGAVTGATVQENADLLAKRQATGVKVTAAETLDALTKLADEVKALKDAVGLVENAVEARHTRQQAVELGETQVANPEGAAPDALKKERDAITDAFKTPPLNEPDIVKGEQALVALQGAANVLDTSLEPLRKRRDVARSMLKAVTTEFDVCVDGLPPSLKEEFQRAAASSLGECNNKLNPPLDASNLDSFNASLQLLRKAISTAIRSVPTSNDQARPLMFGYISAQAEKLLQQANGVDDLGDKAIAKKKKTAEEQGRTFKQEIKKNTGGSLGRANDILPRLQTTVDGLIAYAGPEAARLSEERAQLQLDIGGIKYPANVAADFTVLLDGLKQTASKTLSAKKLTQIVIDNGTQQAADFAAMLKLAAIDAPPGVEVAKAITGLGSPFDPASVTARAPGRAQVTRDYDVALKASQVAAPNRDMPLAAKLFKALQDRVAELKSEPPVGTTVFTGVTATPQVQAQVTDLFGGMLLNGLDQAAVTALCDAVSTNGPAITDLVSKGLGGKPKIIESLVKTCGGDGLSALATAFGGSDADTARTALLGLVDNGGLNENPAALASMLQHEVDAPKGDGSAKSTGEKAAERTTNATRMKNMTLAFADAGGPKAMRGLLTDSDLGTSPVPGKPSAIASVLHAGVDGDAARMRGFANAFSGDDPAKVQDRANLKNLVNSGGVGAHPSVLGPLVKTSGADKLKKIGTAFTDPADAANLKTMLDNGGMSGDTTVPGKKHEHPDTLAKVFHDGFGDSADKLKRFTKTFKGAPTESKEMLDAWNEWPDDQKDRRQPGDAIAGMLAKFPGNASVEKLQTTFTTQVKGVADPTLRKQAIRFAPSMCTDTAKSLWADDPSSMKTANISKVLGFVSKRHSPECFDYSQVAADNTQFPPGTDVKAMAEAVVNSLQKPINMNRTYPVTIGNIDMEIAFGTSEDGQSYVIHHFGPRPRALPAPPHPEEAPNFSGTDMTAIMKSIGKLAP